MTGSGRGGQRPTVHTVAKAAGVGVGTVSRVLNNHPSVRGETRERVLAVIEQLNYRPTAQSRRSLTPGVHPLVGIIIKDIYSSWECRILRGAEEGLQSSAHDLVAFPMGTPERVEQVVQATHLSSQVQGIMLCNDEVYRQWNSEARPQPVVRVGGIAEEMDYVAIDNRYGGLIAGEYAASLPGSIVGVWPKQPNAARVTTRRGFNEAVEDAGRRVDLELEINCNDHAPRLANEVIDATLAAVPSGATLMAFSDELAQALLTEVQQRGLTVGQDIRIIGYGDHGGAAVVGLTTVHQPLEDMARLSAELLLERIREAADGGLPVRDQQFRMLAPRLALRGTA